jgi:hypothetical protein
VPITPSRTRGPLAGSAAASAVQGAATLIPTPAEATSTRSRKERRESAKSSSVMR